MQFEHFRSHLQDWLRQLRLTRADVPEPCQPGSRPRRNLRPSVVGSARVGTRCRELRSGRDLWSCYSSPFGRGPVTVDAWFRLAWRRSARPMMRTSSHFAIMNRIGTPRPSVITGETRNKLVEACSSIAISTLSRVRTKTQVNKIDLAQMSRARSHTG